MGIGFNFRYLQQVQLGLEKSWETVEYQEFLVRLKLK